MGKKKITQITDTSTLKAELGELILSGSCLSNIAVHYQQRFKKKLSDQHVGVKLTLKLENLFPSIEIVKDKISFRPEINIEGEHPLDTNDEVPLSHSSAKDMSGGDVVRIKSELEELILGGSSLSTLPHDYQYHFHQELSRQFSGANLKKQLLKMFPKVQFTRTERIFFQQGRGVTVNITQTTNIFDAIPCAPTLSSGDLRLKSELEELIWNGFNLSDLPSEYQQRFQRKLLDQHPGMRLKKKLEELFPDIEFVLDEMISLPSENHRTYTAHYPESEAESGEDEDDDVPGVPPVLSREDLILRSELMELFQRKGSKLSRLSDDYRKHFHKNLCEQHTGKLSTKVRQLFPDYFLTKTGTSPKLKSHPTPPPPNLAPDSSETTNDCEVPVSAEEKLKSELEELIRSGSTLYTITEHYVTRFEGNLSDQLEGKLTTKLLKLFPNLRIVGNKLLLPAPQSAKVKADLRLKSELQELIWTGCSLSSLPQDYSDRFGKNLSQQHSGMKLENKLKELFPSLQIVNTNDKISFRSLNSATASPPSTATSSVSDIDQKFDSVPPDPSLPLSDLILKSELEELLQSGSTFSSLPQDYSNRFHKNLSDQHPGVRLKEKLTQLFPDVLINQNSNSPLIAPPKPKPPLLQLELEELIESGSSLLSLSQDYSNRFQKNLSQQHPGMKLKKKLAQLFPSLRIVKDAKIPLRSLIATLSPSPPRAPSPVPLPPQSSSETMNPVDHSPVNGSLAGVPSTEGDDDDEGDDGDDNDGEGDGEGDDDGEGDGDDDGEGDGDDDGDDGEGDGDDNHGEGDDDGEGDGDDDGDDDDEGDGDDDGDDDDEGDGDDDGDDNDEGDDDGDDNDEGDDDGDDDDEGDDDGDDDDGEEDGDDNDGEGDGEGDDDEDDGDGEGDGDDDGDDDGEGDGDDDGDGEDDVDDIVAPSVLYSADPDMELRTELEVLIRSGSSLSRLPDDYRRVFKKKLPKQRPGVKWSSQEEVIGSAPGSAIEEETAGTLPRDSYLWRQDLTAQQSFHFQRSCRTSLSIKGPMALVLCSSQQYRSPRNPGE
jgi:hypothetical protein